MSETAFGDTSEHMGHTPFERMLLNQNSRREHQQYALLYHLAYQLHQSNELDDIVRRTMEQLLAFVSAQRCLVILLDDQGTPTRWFTSDERQAITDIQVKKALTEGAQREALDQQKVLRISDSHQHRTSPVYLLDGRAFLVVPLCAGDVTVGVLTLAHQSPRAFHKQHEVLLTEAADMIARAIYHARCYTNLHEIVTSFEEGKYKLVHDIRSPLTAVMASIEVIKRALKLHPPHTAVHDLIQDSIDSGQRSLHNVINLTNDLLDARRLQIGQEFLEYELVALELLYDDVSKTLQSLALQKHIMLRYQVNPRTLHVSGDVHLLRRLMINLTANALRFTPEGGTITLKADVMDNSANLLLAVEDTGPGVDIADRERIFQPFVQGKGESRRGAGLGLAICREIVVAHQGKIWVEDRPGGGSRFCVILPV